MCLKPGLSEIQWKKDRAVWGSRLGLEKREETWEGDMEGISCFKEGCFCQLGRERMEKRWEVRSGGSGSRVREWGREAEATEEKGLRRRKQRWDRDSVGMIMAVGFLIVEHQTAVGNPYF